MMMRDRFRASAAALWLAASTSVALAAGPSVTTDPGFVPQTGQINLGHAAAPWSATPTLPQDEQPAQEDARAALMTPDPVGVVSLGAAPPAQENGNAATTGAALASAAAATPPGPIGATLQTMPAKFSHRSDLLDHLPVMAWPLRLTQQQRHEIYQSVIAERSPPMQDDGKLKPASALSFAQRQNMHPLPRKLAGIDGLSGLDYVKGKDKVLLVQPSTGIVVDQVTM